jgi:hypothetical protein
MTRRSRPTTHDAVVNAVKKSVPKADYEPILPHEIEKKFERADGDMSVMYASLEFLADEATRQAEILAAEDGAVSVVLDDEDSLVHHVESARHKITRGDK